MKKISEMDRHETWSQWVENTIHHIFYMYDIQGKIEQQKKLKRMCMNELNNHPEIAEEIHTSEQMKYFVIQMAMENIK